MLNNFSSKIIIGTKGTKVQLSTNNKVTIRKIKDF